MIKYLDDKRIVRFEGDSLNDSTYNFSRPEDWASYEPPIKVEFKCEWAWCTSGHYIPVTLEGYASFSNFICNFKDKKTKVTIEEIK